MTLPAHIRAEHEIEHEIDPPAASTSSHPTVNPPAKVRARPSAPARVIPPPVILPASSPASTIPTPSTGGPYSLQELAILWNTINDAIPDLNRRRDALIKRQSTLDPSTHQVELDRLEKEIGELERDIELAQADRVYYRDTQVFLMNLKETN